MQAHPSALCLLSGGHTWLRLLTFREPDKRFSTLFKHGLFNPGRTVLYSTMRLTHLISLTAAMVLPLAGHATAQDAPSAPEASSTDTAAARSENRAGLRAHGASRYDTALRHFERALEHDPEHALSRFNAACAASRAGKLDRARAHIDRYLTALPDNALRVLHDPDLAPLLEDQTFLAGLRAKIRPAGSEVREIVYERRDVAELFVAGSDGLDATQITDTPGLRPHSAEFGLDGSVLIYRARKLGEAYSAEANFVSPEYQHRDRYNEELCFMTYPDGPTRTVGHYVRHHQLTAQGDAVVFITGPNQDPPVRLQRVSLREGEPELLAELDHQSGAWCVQQESSGSWLVAGSNGASWGSDVLKVERIREGRLATLFEQGNRVRQSRHFFGITACSLSGDGAVLDLGNARVHLETPVRLETFPERTARPGTITTLRTERHSEDMLPPERWRVDPLSYGNDYGMADHESWSQTAIFLVGEDRSTARVSAENTFIAYGGSLSPDRETLLYTRVRTRTARPWIVRASANGSDAKSLFPGQYPVWSPHLHVIATAGATVAWGPDHPPATDSAPVPGPPADNAAPGTTETRTASQPSSSGCGCNAAAKPNDLLGVFIVLFGALGLRQRARTAT